MLVDNLFQLQTQDLGSNLNWNEELQGSVEAHTYHPVFSGVKADPVSTALPADMVFAVYLSSSSPPGHHLPLSRDFSTPLLLPRGLSSKDICFSTGTYKTGQFLQVSRTIDFHSKCIYHFTAICSLMSFHITLDTNQINLD